MIATFSAIWADITGASARQKRLNLEDRLALALTDLRAANIATEEQRKLKENTIRMYGGLLQQKSDELTNSLNSLNAVLAENVKLQRELNEMARENAELREFARRAETVREAMTDFSRNRKIEAVKNEIKNPKVIPLNGVKNEAKK
jgi:predicted RNase H-like nuclease (RuvC/YqgF family)